MSKLTHSAVRQLLADFVATRYNQVAERNEMIDTYSAHLAAGGTKAYVVDPSCGHTGAIAVDKLHARGVHTYYVTNAAACLLTSSFVQHTLGS